MDVIISTPINENSINVIPTEENCINVDSSSFPCNICNRSFHSKRGLNQHLRYCIDKKVDTDATSNGKNEPRDRNVFIPETIESRVLYRWGEYNDKLFEENLNYVYEKVVYWKTNLFLLPTGNAGKQYIDEVARLGPVSFNT